MKATPASWQACTIATASAISQARGFWQIAGTRAGPRAPPSSGGSAGWWRCRRSPAARWRTARRRPGRPGLRTAPLLPERGRHPRRRRRPAPPRASRPGVQVVLGEEARPDDGEAEGAHSSTSRSGRRSTRSRSRRTSGSRAGRRAPSPGTFWAAGHPGSRSRRRRPADPGAPMRGAVAAPGPRPAARWPSAPPRSPHGRPDRRRRRGREPGRRAAPAAVTALLAAGVEDAGGRKPSNLVHLIHLGEQVRAQPELEGPCGSGPHLAGQLAAGLQPGGQPAIEDGDLDRGPSSAASAIAAMPPSARPRRRRPPPGRCPSMTPGTEGLARIPRDRGRGAGPSRRG
jgi:hypothetical protein